MESSIDAIELLESYILKDIGSPEKTLAKVALRWIVVDSTAAQDPLLADLFTRAKALLQNTKAGADIGVYTDAKAVPEYPMRRLNILDYFGTSGGSVGLGEVDAPKQSYRIYCDGACAANGRRGARAGYGAIIYDSMGKEVISISMPLDSTEAQTNQRAELRALQWAFTKAMSLPEGAEIHTDSQYAIKCFTEWGALWAAKGWRKAGGGEVLHQDILKPMWEIWKSRGKKIKLFHVSAHTGGRDIHSLGNAKADALAVASLSH